MSGYAMVNGDRFTIIGITLERGMIIFRAERRGPAREFNGTAVVTIFGDDHVGVMQGTVTLQQPEAGPEDKIMIPIELNMRQCFGSAEAGYDGQ